MQVNSFLIESSSKLLVTRTGIKARMTSILGLWFPWPIHMFLKWDLTLAHWTQVSDLCPLGYLFWNLCDVFCMEWRCACGLDIILWLFVLTFLLCEFSFFSVWNAFKVYRQRVPFTHNSLQFSTDSFETLHMSEWVRSPTHTAINS